MFSELFQLEQKPVTVFKSSDPSAPTLTNDAGSLKTLLKACLITGYGDKQSLGWSMPFESADLKSAAFVSTDPKSGKYVLKIANSDATYAYLSVYQSMSSIDSGVKPVVENRSYRLLNSARWTLIGHSRAFILLLDTSFGGQQIADPLLFGDLPKQVKRAEPLCVLWCSRRGVNQNAGMQATLFYNRNGYAGGSGSASIAYSNVYPFTINNGSGSANLTQNACRFSYGTKMAGTVLFEPVLSSLPDSTWTFIPMLQPLSQRLVDVANLGNIDDDTIKADTGKTYAQLYNYSCAVPTNWWYA